MAKLYIQQQASLPITSSTHQRYLAIAAVMGYFPYWQPWVTSRGCLTKVTKISVDRCLKVGCGSVAMLTFLLLRRLLPSYVATFTPGFVEYFSGGQ